MPSAVNRRRIRVAVKKFEHAYAEWLDNPLREVADKPTAKQFGLQPAHVATIAHHLEAQARRRGDLSKIE